MIERIFARPRASAAGAAAGVLVMRPLLRRIEPELAQQGLGRLNLRAGVLAPDQAEHHLGERAQGEPSRGVAHLFLAAERGVEALANLAPGPLSRCDLLPAREVGECTLMLGRFAGLGLASANRNREVVGAIVAEDVDDAPQVLGALVEEPQPAGLVAQKERRGRERLARGFAFLEELHRRRKCQRLHRRALRIAKPPAAPLG
ncbi:MAG: hypothetical protein KDH09_19935, partial [Chrysiogenetes bacterium]|nr:hypothetical protein [Chrysiogenetes bacterium]